MSSDFVDNRYWRIYQAICDRARYRPKPIDYVEDHHVTPRSLGGVDNETVWLTAREHYVAHLCLVRCTIGAAQAKMALAVLKFQRCQNSSQRKAYQSIRFNSRHFARLRQLVAVQQSLERTGDPRWAYRAGTTHTAETKELIRAALKGRRKSVEHITNQAAAHRGKKHHLSEASRERMREAGRKGAAARWHKGI